MMRKMFWTHWFLGLFFLVAAGEAAILNAAEQAGELPLDFRRVYAPLDRLSEWPAGSTVYKPINANDFERLVTRFLGPPTDTTLAQIVSSKYTAHLQGADLLVGEVTMEVRSRSDRPVMMPIMPCEIALADPEWEDEAGRRPAQMGLDSENRMVLLVGKSGKLHCRWSLRGRRDTGGQLKFQFQLPPSLTKKLILTLPDSLQPDFRDGFVSPRVDTKSDQKIWEIDIPGRNRLQMRIVRNAANGVEGRFNLLKQALTYSLSMRGLQLDAELTLGVYREPLKQLVLRLAPELQLVDAKLGAQRIAWATKGQAEEGTLRTVLSFPQPIIGADRVLRLTAVAPLVSQGPWELPGIEPQGLFWQEGGATLLVAEPLSIVRMQLEGCRQLRTSTLPGKGSGEAVELQYHGPEAKAEVLLSAVPADMAVEALTTFELDDRAINGRMVCDFTVQRSEKFKLQAKVASNWQIESVVSWPSGVVESWEQQGPGSEQILNIYLNRGISSEKPLRLGIAGRNRRPTVRNRVDSDDLQMLKFDEMQRHIAHVIAREPFRLKATGPDALRQLAPSALQAADRHRLAENFSNDRVTPADRLVRRGVAVVSKAEELAADDLEGMFWLNDPGPARFQLALEKPSPQFATVTRITVRVEENNLQENVHIECAPEESSVDWVLVHFAEQRDEIPRWSVIDAKGVVLDTVRAVRVPTDPQSGQVVGETWKVSWTRPLSEKFQIVAERNTQFEDRVPVNLVSLSQATEQLGTVTVFSDEAARIVAENRALKSLPAEQVPSHQKNQVVARYRYDPDRHLGGGARAALLVGVKTSFARAAVVWQAVGETWFVPDGSGRHRLTYYLENDGNQYFTVTLGSDTHLNAAKIDGVDVRLPQSESTGSISLALPKDRRFSVVELQLETGAVTSWLDMFRSIQLPTPELDIAILNWRRILHAPAGFKITDGIDRGADGRDAPGWRERLFGSLARRENSVVFDPFDGTHWSVSAFLPLVDSGGERQLAFKFLDTFGRVLEQNAEVASWRQLAEINQRDEVPRLDSANEKLEVWVDSQALSEAGLGPSSPIRVSADRSHRQVALDALMSTNLVVAVGRNRLLISSADRLQPSATRWFIEGVVCGTYRKDTDSKRANSMDPQAIVPAVDWVANEDSVKSPWKVIWRDGYAVTENQSAPTCYLGGKPARNGKVFLIHAASRSALQWTLFLVVAIGGCVWPLSKLRLGLLLILVLAVLTLVVPAAIAPLASAVLWGVVVAIVWQLLSLIGRAARKNRLPRPRSDASLSTTRTMRFVGPEPLLLLVAVGLATGIPRAVVAQTQPEATAGDPNPAIVFIPVDSEQRPVGETYYVPEALFKALHRRARSESEGPSDWLLTGATYRGQMEWELDRSRLVLTKLIGSFAVEVFGHHAHVRIPVGGTFEDLAGRITVDGKSARRVQSSPDGMPIVEIDAPGIYQIEIALSPEMEVIGGMQRVDLPIPPLATSRLELDLPVDSPPIEVASATGGTLRENVQGRVTAQLGAAPRLELAWRNSTGVDAGAVADVDRLLWLKIQPGAVMVDARIRLNVKEHRVRRLQIAADPHLRLLSPMRAVVNGEPVELLHVRTIPGEPQIIELEFTHSVTGVQEIRLPFLLAGITGVGNVRLPYLDLIGARTSRHWVAVSVDPALHIDRNSVPPNEGLIAVSATVVSDPWDIAEQKPALFYRQTQLGIDWSFPTTPQESETMALQRISFGFSDTHVDAIAEFDLETTAGHRFHYHVQVPDGFVAQQVELISEGVDRVSRWTISPDEKIGNRLTLFLNGPVTGKQQLAIRGQFVGGFGEIRLPDFHLDGIRSRGSQIALYRQPAVQVELKSGTNLQQVTDGDIVPSVVPADFGRLVGIFSVDDDAGESRVELHSNETEATALQVISVDRINGQWTAEVDLRLSVGAGVLDVLRLRIPPEYPGPFHLEPDVPHSVENFASGESRVLVVHPPEAISGNYQLIIRGPLIRAAGDLVSCPVISTDEISKSTRYVVLPKQVDFQDVQWKTSGLVSRPIPKDPQRAPLAETSIDSFLVTGATYRAVLKSVDRPRQAPRIQLADIKIKGQTQESYIGRAMFDLEPASLSSVQIRLPSPEARLLRARVAGLAASPQHRGGSWELELGSENLSQSIEVLYEAPFAVDSEGAFVADAPQLYAGREKIAVLNTLWSITGSEMFWSRFNADEMQSKELLLQQQHKRIGCMLDLLSDVTSAEPIQILSPWYRRQVARLNTVRRELAKCSRSENSQQSLVLSARQMAFDERFKELGEELIAQGVFASREQFQTAGVRTADAWDWAFANEGPHHLGVFKGEKGKFSLGRPADGKTSLLARLVLVLALTAVGLFVGFGNWRPEGLRLREVSVFGVAFFVAMFYWLFLTPSILGFVAILVSVALALWFRWDRMIDPSNQRQFDVY